MEKNNTSNRSLVGSAFGHIGACGGFSFGGEQPQGVTVLRPLPADIVYPNGAQAAILLTYDVEGNYGNGQGDVLQEIANYQRICKCLEDNNVVATFNVVGQMVDDYGPDFVGRMLEANCEVASHGHTHDLNKRKALEAGKGDKVYAGQYGYADNYRQIASGIDSINKHFKDTVTGVRLPYAHFNEFSYDAIESLGLKWSSHVGIDDFMHPDQGFGGKPFQMSLGNKKYACVEIPLDSQTFDWAIWMADEKENATFVSPIKSFCEQRNIVFDRTPRGAYHIWRERILTTIESKDVFTLLAHPINFTVKNSRWDDPVDSFMIPVIDLLGELHREKKIWACTSDEMADFYNQTMGRGRGQVAG